MNTSGQIHPSLPRKGLGEGDIFGSLVASPYWRGSDCHVTDPTAGWGRQRFVVSPPSLEDSSLKTGMVKEGFREERALQRRAGLPRREQGADSGLLAGTGEQGVRSAGGGQGPGLLSSHRRPRAARARVRVRGAHPLRAPTGQWPWEARGDSAVWHLRARDRLVPVGSQGPRAGRRDYSRSAGWGRSASRSPEGRCGV